MVEGIRDVLAIEETHQYRGMYHVLGGVISPIDGIGPENLHIGELVERLYRDEVREVIMAVSPTIEVKRRSTTCPSYYSQQVFA